MTATATAAARPARSRAGWLRPVVTVAVVALVAWSALGLDLKWNRLPSAPRDLWDTLWLMFSQMTWDDTEKLLQAMWQSIAIAWLGTMLAAVIAVPLSFLAAQNITGKWFGGVMRQVFNLLRSVPEVMLAIAVVPVFGLTPQAGMVALAIGSVGTLAKLSSEAIEGIRPGPVEAAAAVGATPEQSIRWAVLPQVVPEVMAFVLYRFEINIRVSAILGLVGAGGIGSDLQQGLLYKKWGLGGQALLITIGATILIDMLSGAVRRRLLAGPGVSVGDADTSAAATAAATADAALLADPATHA